MRKILVTGGNGQLATCIKDMAIGLNGYGFIYVDLDELDITKQAEVNSFFESENISFCVNCAAYTAVDKAETEREIAVSVNETGAQNLAKACNKYDAGLIQISTDFVFDGKKSSPYIEEDSTKPLGVYGLTKLKGEQEVVRFLPNSFIIRTSWLYSEHGQNFLKTMLRLGSERDNLNVVADQIGTPTYAGDLAQIILKIITEDRTEYGIYHYSNEGVASWYDFTKAIFRLEQIDCRVNPIRTDAYPTPAKRPAFSVMDKAKIKKEMDIEIPHWRDSLMKCLQKAR
ncbi:dTDP-4-dehydrorhamnose reductase [Maribacter sp. 2304DJ31-5]|uniref:dTDP-4-dehydrorhamnose reductase n=1 Tax=Maribacter sp. 2304DJ31-5 TaxID=3386273 RepID=UPI0039BD5797